jgi:hypothetical protein
MARTDAVGPPVAERHPTIRLRAVDVSGQKKARLARCPTDCTVSELVAELLGQMHLPPNDTSGRPVTYEARLDREGRSLRDSEVVGESLQEDDLLVLQPSVDAG